MEQRKRDEEEEEGKGREVRSGERTCKPKVDSNKLSNATQNANVHELHEVSRSHKIT